MSVSNRTAVLVILLCMGAWAWLLRQGLDSTRTDIDFTSNAGLRRTCDGLNASIFEHPEDRLARVLCRAVELTQRSASLAWPWVFGKKPSPGE